MRIIQLFIAAFIILPGIFSIFAFSSVITHIDEYDTNSCNHGIEQLFSLFVYMSLLGIHTHSIARQEKTNSGRSVQAEYKYPHGSSSLTTTCS